MNHPTPQPPEEMEREVMQSIRRICWDMIREIDKEEFGKPMDILHDLLETQWRRRHTIMSSVRVPPRQL